MMILHLALAATALAWVPTPCAPARRRAQRWASSDDDRGASVDDLKSAITARVAALAPRLDDAGRSDLLADVAALLEPTEKTARYRRLEETPLDRAWQPFEIARRFEYMPPGEGWEPGDGNSINIGELVPGCHLQISNRAGNRTPPRYRADTQTEMALRLVSNARAARQYERCVLTSTASNTAEGDAAVAFGITDQFKMWEMPRGTVVTATDFITIASSRVIVASFS